MPRLEDVPEALAEALRAMRAPDFGDTRCVAGPKLADRRIAVITTAAVHRRADKPFASGATDYRVLPRERMNELVSSHISPNFDRSGYAEDLNVVLPLDRLCELADEGVIGGVGDFHYSFNGATVIDRLEKPATEVAARLKDDGVGGVLLVPI